MSDSSSSDDDEFVSRRSPKYLSKRRQSLALTKRAATEDNVSPPRGGGPGRPAPCPPPDSLRDDDGGWEGFGSLRAAFEGVEADAPASIPAAAAEKSASDSGRRSSSGHSRGPTSDETRADPIAGQPDAAEDKARRDSEILSLLKSGLKSTRRKRESDLGGRKSEVGEEVRVEQDGAGVAARSDVADQPVVLDTDDEDSLLVDPFDDASDRNAEARRKKRRTRGSSVEIADLIARRDAEAATSSHRERRTPMSETAAFEEAEDDWSHRNSTRGSRRRSTAVLEEDDEEEDLRGQAMNAGPLEKDALGFDADWGDDPWAGGGRGSSPPRWTVVEEEEDVIEVDSGSEEDPGGFGGVGSHSHQRSGAERAGRASPTTASIWNTPNPVSLSLSPAKASKRVMGSPARNFGANAASDLLGGASASADVAWQDRLRNFKPIRVLDRSYGTGSEPVYIQYKKQFPSEDKGNISQGRAGSSTSAKGKGRRSGGGGETDFESRWITQSDGTRGFVTATQVLTGSKAYKAYEKSKGKGKPAAASKRRKGKRRF